MFLLLDVFVGVDGMLFETRRVVFGIAFVTRDRILLRSRCIRPSLSSHASRRGSWGRPHSGDRDDQGVGEIADAFVW